MSGKDEPVSSQKLSPEFEAASASPEGRESGDFHAAVPISDGSGDVAVVLGDVAGHGGDKATQAERVRGEVTKGLAAGESPAQALADANKKLEADPELEDFATVVAARVESGTGRVTYASAGHEPAMVTSPDGDVHRLESTGPPLGVVPGDAARYGEAHSSVPPDGTLLAYSDGITESRRPFVGDRFGEGRLAQLLGLMASWPLVRLIRTLLGRVLDFCRGRFLDDASLLGLRRHDEEGSSS